VQSARKADASDSGRRHPARYGQNDRAIAVTRKGYLFLGSDEGGRRAAAIYTIVETCKLCGLNPQAYLADLIDRLAKGIQQWAVIFSFGYLVFRSVRSSSCTFSEYCISDIIDLPRRVSPREG